MQYKVDSGDYFSKLFSWYNKQIDGYYFDLKDQSHLTAKLELKLIKIIPRDKKEFTDQLIFEVIDDRLFFLARLEHGI